MAREGEIANSLTRTIRHPNQIAPKILGPFDKSGQLAYYKHVNTNRGNCIWSLDLRMAQ
jgi:hypothetical protein